MSWREEIDKLDLGNNMKSNLKNIDKEVKSYYKILLNDNNIDEFCKNTIALLDYYVEPIVNNGKKQISKIMNYNIQRFDFSKEQKQYIKDYKKNILFNFENKLNNAITYYLNKKDDLSLKDEFVEDIIEIIINNCIKLFKHAQLLELKNKNINKITLISGNNSCSICKLRSKFEYDIDTILNKSNDIFHSFCKLTIKPKINDDNLLNKTINNILNKLKIYIPELISEKEFKFNDDIINDEDFKELINNVEYKNINSELLNRISTFKSNDKILISSNHKQSLDYIIVKFLIIDKLLKFNLDWWEKEYKIKQKTKYISNGIIIYSQPFINYIAEENYKSYFIESAVNYILQPQLLKLIDKKNYNKLKEVVFNNIEFERMT